MGRASLQAASCQVACDFWAKAVAVAVLFMFLAPGYDPDFICRSDLESLMGPAQPLWGLKDDGEALPGPGPALGVRDEPTSQKPPFLVLLHPVLRAPGV